MGIELRVKNTFHPDHAGTLLVASSEATQGLPLAVAGRRNLAMIALEGPSLSTIRNLFGRLCATIDAAGAEIVLAAQPVPGHDPHIIIDAAGVDAVRARIHQDFAREIERGRIDGLRAIGGIALCTVVGDTLAPSWGTLAQRALASEKITPILHSAAPEALTYIIRGRRAGPGHQTPAPRCHRTRAARTGARPRAPLRRRPMGGGWSPPAAPPQHLAATLIFFPNTKVTKSTKNTKGGANAK